MDEYEGSVPFRVDRLLDMALLVYQLLSHLVANNTGK
jgi:hypothetical protein